MTRPNRCRLFLSTLLISLGLSLSANAAGTLTSVAASPNPAAVGAKVLVTVKTNAQPCGYVVNFGNGSSFGPVANGNGTKVFETSYAQPGNYTIQVNGKKKGSKPACKSGPKTTSVVVQGGGSGRGGKLDNLSPARHKALGASVTPKKKAMPNLKLSCDSVPCVKDVKVKPHGTYAEFEVFTSQAASIQIYASTKPLSPKNLGKPPHAAMVLGHNHVSKAQLMNLAPGTQYHYVVKAVDPNGVEMWKKGKFRTLRRVATFSIEKIVVHKDADGGIAGKGEFHVLIRAKGKDQTSFNFNADSGSSYVPLPGVHNFAVDDAPEEVTLSVRIYEKDAGGPGFISEDETHTKKVFVGTSGLGEETQSKFTLRAKYDYDLTVHFAVKVRYLP